MAFAQGKQWTKLYTGPKFPQEVRILAACGLLAMLWTAVVIFSRVGLYGEAFFVLIMKIVGTVAAWIILIVLIGTKAFLFLHSGWMARSRALPTRDITE